MIKLNAHRPGQPLPPKQIDILDLDTTTIVTLRVLLGASVNPANNELYQELAKLTDGSSGTEVTAGLLDLEDNRIKVYPHLDGIMWNRMVENVENFRKG